MAPFVKSGKLRLLAVTSQQREDGFPDVPTARETGHPEIEAINWSGFVVHSATPANAIARLNAETVKALNMPEVRELLRNIAIVPTPTTPDEFAALIKAAGGEIRSFDGDRVMGVFMGKSKNTSAATNAVRLFPSSKG
jgi:tripartite-type tricarboxylate transporter receptor subunit TctC